LNDYGTERRQKKMKEDKKERRTTKKGWKQADAKKFDIQFYTLFHKENWVQLIYMYVMCNLPKLLFICP
jgi:hypothetical protein